MKDNDRNPIYEPEGGDEEAVDAIWIRDGRGRVIRAEVDDDEGD